MEAHLACCGPEGFACSSDENCCLGTTCVNGTCQAVCDVCASGCPYATIKDAYVGMPAGSTIRIAPGEYGGPENSIDTYYQGAKNMTFAPCGDGRVTWVKASNPNYRLQINTAAPDTQVGFIGIDFAYGPGSGTTEFIRLSANTGFNNRGSFLQCTFTGNNAEAIDCDGRNELFVYDGLFENNTAGSDGTACIKSGGRATVRRTVFRNNTTNNTPGGTAMYKTGSDPVLIADSICENNTAAGLRKGGCFTLSAGTTTLRNVQMRGNYANDGGGAINVTPSGTVIFEGSTAAIGNSIKPIERGSGIYCENGFPCCVTPCSARILGTTNANVADNTPADRQCSVRTPDNLYNVDCTTWCLPTGTTVASRDNECNLCCNGCVAGSGDPATCA